MCYVASPECFAVVLSVWMRERAYLTFFLDPSVDASVVYLVK